MADWRPKSPLVFRPLNCAKDALATIDRATTKPAIRLEPDSNVLDEQSPWDSPHDYRLHIRLKRLQCDIGSSVLENGGYLSDLTSCDDLMRNFKTCMQQIYPK